MESTMSDEKNPPVRLDIDAEKLLALKIEVIKALAEVKPNLSGFNELNTRFNTAMVLLLDDLQAEIKHQLGK
jgi:hypothetical protein